MSKGINLILLGLVSALLITIAMPMAAHAGTMTIYNKNCTHLKGLKRKKFVSVYVNAQESHGCTSTLVQVKTGQSKTVALVAQNEKGETCKYRHVAKGVIMGDFDVKAEDFSSVTCKRNLARVCKCIKDRI